MSRIVKLPMANVIVGDRHRKDLGDIDALARSILSVGLLHPIVVDDRHRLVAGHRRFEAWRQIHGSSVPIPAHVVDTVDSARLHLMAERDENTCRKDFAPSEAVALGLALEAIEKPKAKERQSAGGGATGSGKLPQPDGARVREVVAPAVGMSPRTYDKAKAVVAAAEDPKLPEPVRAEARALVEKMDQSGKVDGAFKQWQAIEDATKDTEPEYLDAAIESAKGITKPDIDGVSHPARYTAALVPVFAEMLEGRDRVLDPFAGTGQRLAPLAETHDLVGIELEPEWANVSEWVQQGNALDLPFPDDAFDAICTSPTYGNRLADHHNASDPESRRSYTHDLGRALHGDNSGAMQWGDEYRDFHKRAWAEAVRVLAPGGLFVLNIKDHIRDGEYVEVTSWHLACLRDLGVLVDRVRLVGTPSMRAGDNGTARVPGEFVFGLVKA